MVSCVSCFPSLYCFQDQCSESDVLSLGQQNISKHIIILQISTHNSLLDHINNNIIKNIKTKTLIMAGLPR